MKDAQKKKNCMNTYLLPQNKLADQQEYYQQ